MGHLVIKCIIRLGRLALLLDANDMKFSLIIYIYVTKYDSIGPMKKHSRPVRNIST